MVRFHTCIVWLVAAAFGIILGQAGQALGEDFRVDNAVYAGDQKEPSSQSTTIFHAGVVYDCLKAPAETVVFDKTGGRFVLLNLSHRMRTELTTSEVAAFIDRLQPVAAKSKDPLVAFLAAPKFQERSDQPGELTLASPWITYRLVLSGESSPSVVEQYRDFCDWYARLNALLVPGSQPPFGRLVVDAAMAQRRAIASQVVLTLHTGKGSRQPTTIRSEHRLVIPLEAADLERVARARKFMENFKLVSFDQYQKVESR
jgi:hypothetical protein